MSHIYFHNEYTNDTELSGCERAAASVMCNTMLMLSLGVSVVDDHNDAILRVLPKDSYLHGYRGGDFYNRLAAWIAASEKFVLDRETSIFEAELNTAYVIGGDAVKLMARLHGQCEIHCYVEEQNRVWLAGIIESGLTAGVMRQGFGWDEVVGLFRSDYPGPIVTSYSVCGGFPSPGVAVNAGVWDSKADNWEAWYDLPVADQWRLCMEALRKDQGGLEMRPDNWQDFRFGHCLTGYDVRAYADKKGESVDG